MAVPPPLGNPTWQTIPTQQPFPGQTLRINLRNFNSRNDATVSLLSSTPSWVTLDIQGNRRDLVIATPTSATNADRYTIRLRATAIVSGSPVTRDTSFVLQVRNAIAPTLTPVDQTLQSGVAFSLNVATFLDSGTGLPAPTYSLRGTQNPDWLTLNGSTISGTPPVATYTDPSTDVPIEMRATNVGGSADFTVNLRIARSVGPGVSTIPAQYVVVGEMFTIDLSPYLGGSPTPTILQTGLPSWMRVSGTSLVGTPTGYTASTSITVTIQVQNVVGTISHTFQLFIRVADETFRHQTTGSPIEIAGNNITALTATDSRFYFYSTDSQGAIHAANHGGTIESGEQINLPATNGGNSNDVVGLAAYDGNLYVLGGTGAQWVYKYRLSDRSLIGSQNVAGAGVALAVFPRSGTHYLGVLRTTGTVQVWSLNIPSAQNQIALDFALSEPGVAATDWQSLAYDSLDDTLYAGASGSGGGFMFAFATDGTRQPSDALQLRGANDDPRGAGYGNDRLFIAQHDSGIAQGRIYVYDAIARVLTIPPQEGFDGEAWTFDLAPFLANNITVAFRSGYAVPRWLSLSGNVLSSTALPAVAQSRMDDTYRILLTATHASRNTNFEVELTVKYIEAPSTETAPSQTLDLRVTPQIPNPRPPLVTSVQLHMSDYVTNLARAGTLTFTVQFDDENIASLSSRMVNGVSVTDVLTLTAPTQPLADEPTSSLNIDIRVSNAIGHATIDVPVDITNLVNVYLNNIPNQDVHRDETDSIDLSRYAGGRPPPTFALGTITPRLDESVATIVSNANGRWSIHPNQSLETTDTYHVNVIAINRISRATRAFALTIHGVPHMEPNIAPVWKTGADLQFSIVAGEMQQIELTHLISQARPTPTFTVYMADDFTNAGGTATITGTTLTVHAPNTDEPTLNADIQVSARNAAGGAIGTLSFAIEGRSLPVWGAIPRLSGRTGGMVMLDLNAHVTGMPTPTLAFTTPPTGDGANATLTNGVFRWAIPSTINDVSAHNFAVTATNDAGSAQVTFAVRVEVDIRPEWSTREIIIFAREGAPSERVNLASYLVAGIPTPSLVLDADGFAVPATLTFDKTILIIENVEDVNIETRYDFDIIARNIVGSASKTVSLIIEPSLDLGDITALHASDYDEVRYLLDTRLTALDLPNTVIASDAFQGAAIDWATDRLPVNADLPRTELQLRHKKRAVIFRMAGLLASSVRRLMQETAGSIRTEFESIPWNDLQLSLFTQAEREAVHAETKAETFVEVAVWVEE